MRSLECPVSLFIKKQLAELNAVHLLRCPLLDAMPNPLLCKSTDPAMVKENV